MDKPQEDTETSPWNEGELRLQRSVGAVEQMVKAGKMQMSRNWLPDQHREFYAQLPFVVFGCVDPQGHPWATLRAAQPRFAQSPDPRRLVFDLPREPADPADAGMEDGDGIAMLGIEMHTRRRNRLNGFVKRIDNSGFEIDPTQTYGHCPRYIQLRRFVFSDAPPGQVSQSDTLSADDIAMITSADAFFVASYVERDGKRHVDVSHRGGKPGFVRVDENGRLTVPEFNGNLFFNTLGNMLLNPRAGLVFVDMHSGDLMHLTGRSEVIIDSPETQAFVGAERMWHFFPEQVIRRPRGLPLHWEEIEGGMSPNVLMTGSWDDMEMRLKAAELKRTWRPYRVIGIDDESASIRSFRLLPDDGVGTPTHLAGQHLPIRVTLPGQDAPLLRTYTLSNAPRDDALRISVKRDGAVSSHLHDTLRVGDRLEALAPSGAFTVDHLARRSVVFLAAGVGVTPSLAMARHLVQEGIRTLLWRRTWVFQSASNKTQLAFQEEFAGLVTAANGKLNYVRALSDVTEAEHGVDYEHEGRLSIDLLREKLPFDDYDFYLCGPQGFMQQMYDGLRALDINDGRIHAEAFGPSSLQRSRDDTPPLAALEPVATESVTVTFNASNKKALWNPDAGSLLELAEENGLTPPFGCRNGSCGSCRTKVLGGAVTYERHPEFPLPAGEALMCCAVPAKGTEAVQLDV
ncbi:pyridoxamine 5'-phosphate oxidase family protein [Pseudomonas sp. SLFW]|uniref:2Fe-2S iron-sulfur cluster-binding protein n=1 Tax=Pseudomonas sp. SLFW TaxID=2683259 RepID=UPI0014124FCB|nr:pyridoxamine 5'-phosphate oxidase family protein [Pseudomonas sp. SLFW]NBB13105.1 2Fe-2S iron-sulfur cluster binding domain-containing protein [Pseudomonas sp. SLFW]